MPLIAQRRTLFCRPFLHVASPRRGNPADARRRLDKYPAHQYGADKLATSGSKQALLAPRALRPAPDLAPLLRRRGQGRHPARHVLRGRDARRGARRVLHQLARLPPRAVPDLAALPVRRRHPQHAQQRDGHLRVDAWAACARLRAGRVVGRGRRLMRDAQALFGSLGTLADMTDAALFCALPASSHPAAKKSKSSCKSKAGGYTVALNFTFPARAAGFQVAMTLPPGHTVGAVRGARLAGTNAVQNGTNAPLTSIERA
jgi:hypothetical protein